ncbi:putative aldo keto reductase protein [Zalerion maritima]|uniref:Aldo keto reductase protein n=1 Tax=Zalerion maritima TaxID=339359 RepID=A0AAD5RKM3_9PEZI|nr:putative aldo keto reductase protein [Zalerion maritima]
MAAKTALPIVFGTMTIGNAGVEGVRISDLPTTNTMLDMFQSHGHSEIDNARLYGAGSSEKYFASANWSSRGLVMNTKLPPKYQCSTCTGPNHATPLEDTLREVNKLHPEGCFDRLGVSNYMSREVAAICEICGRNGWVTPAVYQGTYNALHRAIEPGLIPCLRHYGMALYAFQPWAGGFLTSRYRRDMRDEDYEKGSRFDPTRWQGRMHHGRYINDMCFDALDVMGPVMQKFGLTQVECALRWLLHHSEMSKENGDKMIIGASSPEQLEGNLRDLEKGELPGEVVEAMDAAWARVKGVVPRCFH